MLSLLNLICDVAVELDGEQRIVEHVPRFAAMLAMPTFKDTKGLRLQDFMPSKDDQERLCQQLQQGHGDHSSTGALHVRLRDSMGSDVNAEVFYVAFAALDDCTHYFAGIRESAEYTVAELQTFGPGRKSKRGGHRDAPEVGKGTSAVLVSQPVCPGPGLAAAAAAVPPGPVGALAPAAPTPPAFWDQTASDTSEAPSGGSSGSSFTQTFALTKDMGKDVSIVATLARWYLHVGEEHCCPFHAAVRELRDSVQRLEGFGCANEFAACGRLQCNHCGVLAEGRSGDTCDVCRRRIFRPVRCPARSRL